MFYVFLVAFFVIAGEGRHNRISFNFGLYSSIDQPAAHSSRRVPFTRVMLTQANFRRNVKVPAYRL